MANLEKVIRGLECIAQRPNGVSCYECAYFRPLTDDPEERGWCDKVVIADDAIALLKEQETHLVHRYSRPGVYADLWLYCEVCGGKVDDDSIPKFCPNCGRKVKERG